MYIVYAIVFVSGRIYVGMTGKSLEERMKGHKRNKTRSTKNRAILKVVEIETCSNRMTARKREKYWKSGCGRERLKIYCGVEQSGSSSGS